MSVLIAASAALTCLGDEPATFAALVDGASGSGRLRYFSAERLNVTHGYHVAEDGPEGSLRASDWLTVCVSRAVASAGLDPARQRVVALVGSGLRELRAVERLVTDDVPVSRSDLHFARAVRAAVPGVEVVTTISNACSAGGYALALGQDLIELDEADAVVVAGTDAMTESMLAMIGRFADRATEQVRPFDASRTGVLLGEGAAAFVLVGEGACDRPRARLLGTGLSCDAGHETAPDPAGIRRAMTDALDRAGRGADDVDVVFAHGTGTELNDPAEAAVLREIFPPDPAGPLITGLKGAVGHTSGASALTSLAIAVQSLHTGLVPPVVGLEAPLVEGAGLRFVSGRARRQAVRLAQVNAFGFGGVNAVSLIEAA